ncbi:MAG: phosphodiester glycosidase family protein [Treponemataceae bacterium]
MKISIKKQTFRLILNSIFVLACTLFFVVIFSCATMSGFCKNPKYFLTCVDLDFEKIELVCFPNEDTKMKNGWVNSMYAKLFAKKNDCFIAFNTSPFEVENVVQHIFNRRKNVGVHKVAGKLLNPPVEYFGALVFKDGKADIIFNQTREAICQYDYAFGGFFCIIYDGKKIEFDRTEKDERTVVGLNEDKSKMYVLTGHNLSFSQCSDILLEAGCTQAINFDGGSSTQVYVKDKFYSGFCVPPGSILGFRYLKEKK